MALPPTMIYHYVEDEPEETYDRLQRAGLLKRSARKDKAGFIQDLANAEKEYFAKMALVKNGGPGENLTDTLAGRLRSYLNKTGLKLIDMQSFGPGKGRRFFLHIRVFFCRLGAFFS